MHTYQAEIKIIVGNPYVTIPEEILQDIFAQADRNKGHIPVRGKINGKDFLQTLVKYSGGWKLYINMIMLKNSPRRIGEIINVEIEYDPIERIIAPHPKWTAAIESNEEAKKVFDALSPSRQKEIVRYISNLKKEETVERNVERAINHLLGKGRFVGRAKP